MGSSCPSSNCLLIQSHWEPETDCAGSQREEQGRGTEVVIDFCIGPLQSCFLRKYLKDIGKE